MSIATNIAKLDMHPNYPKPHMFPGNSSEIMERTLVHVDEVKIRCAAGRKAGPYDKMRPDAAIRPRLPAERGFKPIIVYRSFSLLLFIMKVEESGSQLSI